MNKLYFLSITIIILLGCHSVTPPKASREKSREIVFVLPEDSQKHINVIYLDGLMGNTYGDIGGKRLTDVIEVENIVKAVVLQNNTSMPSQGHIGHILFRMFHENPKIQSLWEKDEGTGVLRRLDNFDTANVFFAVLFMTAEEEYVGFLANHDAVRVVSKDGDGYVSWK